MTLEKRIEDLLTGLGAAGVGIATTETLAGGPPSTDLEYVLPGARSAVSFSVALDHDQIRPYLGKETEIPYQDAQDVYRTINNASEEVAELLRNLGHDAVSVAAHLELRPDSPDPIYDPKPPLSHRYVAVACGVGSFGWSGMVGHVDHGSNILLGATVTSAELTPTDPIPEDKGFCNDCRACVASCPVEMFFPRESESVTMNGRTYTYSKRVDKLRCTICCGGLAGVHKNGKWGSWSPGHFTLPPPEDTETTKKIYVELAHRSKDRPDIPGLSVDRVDFGDHPMSNAPLYSTCGNCQYVCSRKPEERVELVKILRNAGTVIQEPTAH